MTDTVRPTMDGVPTPETLVLEQLGRCPACAGPERDVMFAGLIDGVFRAAPGEWTLHRCRGCDCAYLDPRPTADTIGLAYRRYYTHSAPKPGRLPSRRRNLKGWMRNGDLNRRYGYAFAHAAPAWLAAALLGPLDRARQDVFVRHLPAPGAGTETLLDVGCGDGAFLEVARDCGYAVTGLEPDPVAVEGARSRGLEVHLGTLPSPALAADSFDHITLNHVLEHVHDPVATVREALRLLKPGGRLWVALPNLDAQGLARFGPHWIGLEAPRHLTLFTEPSLRRLLVESGFVDVQAPSQDPDAPFYFYGSTALAEGLDPYARPKLSDPATVRRQVAAAIQTSQQDPRRNESLTLIAFKASR